MQGIVKNIIGNKGFGFIRDQSGVEYFFHREEYNGHWDDLTADAELKRDSIRVEFDPTTTSKGPRATNVTRLDFPHN